MSSTYINGRIVDTEEVLKTAKWRHSEGYSGGATLGDLGEMVEIYEHLKERADFMESQLAKMAGALAYEGRENLDELGDGDFYLWFVERWGDDDDKANAGIEDEEE